MDAIALTHVDWILDDTGFAMHAVRKIDANVEVIPLADEFIHLGWAEIRAWRVTVSRDAIGEATGRVDDPDM